MTPPGVGVDVDERITEYIKDLLELEALGVVGEVAVKDVSDIGRIGGHEMLLDVTIPKKPRTSVALHL